MTKFHEKPNVFVSEIVLKVIDLEKSIKFYTKIMGFNILTKKESQATLTIDGLNPIVTLTTSKGIIPKVPKRTGLYHFAILLPSRAQLGLFIKNMRDEQYPIIGGANHGVSEAIYLEDPDGNGIEVYRDTATSEWSRSGDQINMVTDPLDYDEIIDEAGKETWSTTPPQTIIGHIHLHVGDLDKARKFYGEGLGLDVTMEAGTSAIFLSSGGYHHHIGLNVWNGRNAQPLPENSVGMKYYTLKFPSEKLREDIIKNLMDLGYEVMKKENNVYTKDPSNNLLKLAV